MKLATRFLFLLAFILLLAILLTPRAEGGDCRAVSFTRPYTPVYSAPVTYVREVEKVNYVNVARFFDVPLYNVFFNTYAPGVAAYGGHGGVQAGYVPPAPVQTTCEQKLAAYELRLQKLEGRPADAVPRTSPGPMSKAETPEAPVAGIAGLLSTHCAACHDKTTASKGGNLTLTEGGKVAALSPETVGKVIEAVSSKSMPKGKPMSDAERLAFTLALVSGK